MHELRLYASPDKAATYQSLLPQIAALLEGEPDVVANMANTAAALKQAFNWWWTGFYLVKNNELVLGPFQGPVACTRIASGKGVCGTAWQEKRTVIVPDVNQFPGHIACNAESKSEIVIPITKNNEVIAVLDVDSDALNAFDETDATYLGEVVKLIRF